MACRNEYLRKYPNKTIYKKCHARTGPLVFVHTEESKLKMSISRKGKPTGRFGFFHSEESKIRISLSGKGRIPWNKGLIGIFVKEKSMNWQGGKSFEEYGTEFNRDLKQEIRSRDKHMCRNCGKHRIENARNLEVHHIDFNKKNNSYINLISLCKSCHTKTTSTKNRVSYIKYYEDKVGISDNSNLINLL